MGGCLVQGDFYCVLQGVCLLHGGSGGVLGSIVSIELVVDGCLFGARRFLLRFAGCLLVAWRFAGCLLVPLCLVGVSSFQVVCLVKVRIHQWSV